MPMTAVAVELLTRPPATDPAPETNTTPALAPDDIAYVADTDRLLTMCSCSASDAQPY
jgi:hypothetical protein